MAGNLTPIEQRVLRAICASDSPLGASALGLSVTLAICRNTVSTTAQALECKGFCSRERIGMRIYVRATPAALGYMRTPGVELQKSFPIAELPAGHPAESPIPAPILQASRTEILRALARSAVPVSVSRLVELTTLDYRTIHRQAHSLYINGFVARQRDERRWYWALTNKGRAQLEGRALPQTAESHLRRSAR